MRGEADPSPNSNVTFNPGAVNNFTALVPKLVDVSQAPLELSPELELSAFHSSNAGKKRKRSS
jgi:hypothetical protein